MTSCIFLLAKLDNAIRNDDWDIYDIFGSDMIMQHTFDCIICYITERQQLLKFTKRYVCKEALLTKSEQYNCKSKLDDMLDKCFVHPHIGFYNFINI